MRVLFPSPSWTYYRLVRGLRSLQPAVVDHPLRSNWLRNADARRANGCHLHPKHVRGALCQRTGATSLLSYQIAFLGTSTVQNGGVADIFDSPSA